jgi:hypothetical protein
VEPYGQVLLEALLLTVLKREGEGGIRFLYGKKKVITITHLARSCMYLVSFVLILHNQ